MIPFKLTIGVKVFLTYLVIGSGIAWYLIDKTPEKLAKGIDKAAEEVMIDTANLLAQSLSVNSSDDQISVDEFKVIIDQYLKRSINAQIYDFNKDKASLQIYITDEVGKVIYDSTDRYVGEDFSNDRDVYLTLRGQYGARASAYDRSNKEPASNEKAFYVAAPIYNNRKIVGSLTVVKPVSEFSAFSASQREQIEYYAAIILLSSLIFGAGISFVVSRSTNKLVDYTTKLSKGENVQSPKINQVEFKELSKAIEKLRLDLEDREYIEEFISTMAHELRSPITGIRLTAENLLLPMESSQREHFVKNILDANSRMDLLVTRILELSKLERRDKLDKKTKIYVKRLIKNVLMSPARAGDIKAKNIKIKYDIDRDIEVYVEQILAERALGNIIDNAISFTQQDSTMEIKVRESNRYVQIAILDEGPGIPTYASNRIFSRFYSVARPDTGKRGNGLGLRFVKKIMQLHGGEIELKNRFMANGAEAILKFPIR